MWRWTSWTWPPRGSRPRARCTNMTNASSPPTSTPSPSRDSGENSYRAGYLFIWFSIMYTFETVSCEMYTWRDVIGVGNKLTVQRKLQRSYIVSFNTYIWFGIVHICYHGSFREFQFAKFDPGKEMPWYSWITSNLKITLEGYIFLCKTTKPLLFHQAGHFRGRVPAGLRGRRVWRRPAAEHRAPAGAVVDQPAGGWEQRRDLEGTVRNSSAKALGDQHVKREIVKQKCVFLIEYTTFFTG